MSKEMVADQNLIIKAITAITDALDRENISSLEGYCAMQALIQQGAENGLDVRVERKLQA